MHRTLTSFQLLWPLDCFSIIHSWQVIRKFYRYCTLIGWVGSLAVRSVLSASSSLLAFSTVWNGPQHKVQGSHEDLLCSPQLVEPFPSGLTSFNWNSLVFIRCYCLRMHFHEGNLRDSPLGYLTFLSLEICKVYYLIKIIGASHKTKF